jgi:hypothetical protein
MCQQRATIAADIECHRRFPAFTASSHVVVSFFPRQVVRLLIYGCPRRINPLHILPAFSTLYSSIIKQPSLLSATSDVELLKSATQHFRQHITETQRHKTLADLIVTMFLAASDLVSRSHSSGSQQRLSSFSLKKPTGSQVPNRGFFEFPTPRSLFGFENELAQRGPSHEDFIIQQSRTSTDEGDGQAQVSFDANAGSEILTATTQTLIQPSLSTPSTGNNCSQLVTEAGWDDLSSLLGMENWDGLMVT